MKTNSAYPILNDKIVEGLFLRFNHPLLLQKLDRIFDIKDKKTSPLEDVEKNGLLFTFEINNDADSLTVALGHPLDEAPCSKTLHKIGELSRIKEALTIPQILKEMSLLTLMSNIVASVRISQDFLNQCGEIYNNKVDDKPHPGVSDTVDN